MKPIYKKLLSKGVSIHHVCEVGVYLPETSNVIDFIQQGTRTTLVEADPDVVEKIKGAFPQPSVTVHSVAVWDSDGELRFSRAASSTFATDLPDSPALTNDKYVKKEENTFTVPCTRFSNLDDGTIDLLSIDIEGGEWYVLKHLKSTPKVLSIETHGKYYTNPFMAEINSWIESHNYELWYQDGSDSVYIQKNLFEVPAGDKIETKLANLKTSWKKLKGKLKG